MYDFINSKDGPALVLNQTGQTSLQTPKYEFLWLNKKIQKGPKFLKRKKLLN